MKNFEMPKMNISIFSSEDIITTSVTGQEIAKRALIAEGVAAGDITVVTSATGWVNA